MGDRGDADSHPAEEADEQTPRAHES